MVILIINRSSMIFNDHMALFENIKALVKNHVHSFPTNNGHLGGIASDYPLVNIQKMWKIKGKTHYKWQFYSGFTH
jgi:hypothetical protein